jgi:geranylgeranylglycerol-phosphate geranylgeranyltransferase
MARIELSEYVRITVPYYIPIAIISIFLGIATSGGIFNLNVLLSFVSVSFLIAAFNTFNAVTDLKIDAINKPHRPIPKGKISRKSALVYSFLLYVLSLVLAYFITPQYFVLTAITSLITIFYSVPIIRIRKRFLISNFSGAIIYGLLCPLLGWSISPLNSIPVYILGFTFLFALSLSLSKDFEDYIGDKVFRIKTIPVVLGVKTAKFLSSLMLIMSFAYLMSISAIGLIKAQYLFLIVTLPAFILLIMKIHKNHGKFYNSVEERMVAKKIFYMLMLMAIVVEFLIGSIAIFL